MLAASLAVGALIVAIASFVLQYVTSVFRRRIIYGMLVSARLINPSVVRPDLHIRYDGDELSDPHVLEIAFTYRGRRDIRPASFEDGQPFCIELGVRIIKLLRTVFEPKEEPVPKVEALGTALKVGPSLIRKRQALTFTILTDGPCARLDHRNPLADVKVRQEARPEVREAQRQARLWRLRTILGWAAVIFIVWYLVTNPVGAANAVQGLLGLLKSAGNSLASFFNSL